MVLFGYFPLNFWNFITILIKIDEAIPKNIPIFILLPNFFECFYLKLENREDLQAIPLQDMMLLFFFCQIILFIINLLKTLFLPFSSISLHVNVAKYTVT